MAGFDSQAVRELVERARSPMGSTVVSQVRPELEAALSSGTLSDGDRGRVLVALAVVSQGTTPPGVLSNWLDDAIRLLRAAGREETLSSALGMAAAIHASAGNISACLDRCLSLLALVEETGEALRGRSALNFGVALLALGAYPMAGDQLEQAVLDNVAEDDDDFRSTMTVVGCLNLALVIVGADLVGAVPATEGVQKRRLALIRNAIEMVRTVELAPQPTSFAMATLALCAQVEGDLDGAAAEWGDLDALAGSRAELFSRYLAMIEAPIALHRGDLDRAGALVEHCLSDNDQRSMVPYRRLMGLRLQAQVREQRGDLAGAIVSLREAGEYAVQRANELPDALMRQIIDRAELEQIRRGLLDNTTRLAKLVLVDELSGAGNRRGLELCLDEVRANGEEVALLIMDLDNFKQINDVNGHTTGDRVISAASRILSQACRSTDQIFRYGGDEFVIVPSVPTAAVAYAIAERVQRGFATEDWRDQGVPAGVTASIGIAHGRASEVDEVLSAADVQLYAAKQAGRNTVRPAPEAAPR